jgi:hypothetical protein
VVVVVVVIFTSINIQNRSYLLQILAENYFQPDERSFSTNQENVFQDASIFKSETADQLNIVEPTFFTTLPGDRYVSMRAAGDALKDNFFISDILEFREFIRRDRPYRLHSCTSDICV